MQNNRTPEAVRAELSALTAEIQTFTPVKVMANPMAIRDSALRTCEIMAAILDCLDQVSPYVDEGAGNG